MTPADFNPRSPHGERPYMMVSIAVSIVFQSTLPAWGATYNYRPEVLRQRDFNPRSPHGERLLGGVLSNRQQHFNPRSPHGERQVPAGAPEGTAEISIHAPRMGSDCLFAKMRKDRPIFQSTLPAWGATVYYIVPNLSNVFQSTLPAWGATAKT